MYCKLDRPGTQVECKVRRKFCRAVLLKFIYPEKATKFCEIFTLLLTGTPQDKSKGKFLQNFVAFSEYMNFKRLIECQNVRLLSQESIISTFLCYRCIFKAHQGEWFLRENGLHVHNTHTQLVNRAFLRHNTAHLVEKQAYKCQ